MQAYDYTALDGAGKSRRGTITADGEGDARQRLMAKALYPTDLRPARGGKAGAEGGIRLTQFLRTEKISQKDLALLTRQLATMVQAASPVEEALAALAQQAEKPATRNVITRVRANVMEGMRLSAAMGLESATFDTLFCAMVAAGEASGDLGTVLARIADHREKAQETKAKVQSALIYPAVLMTVAAGVVTALMIFVVPKVVAQFDSFGSDLPMLTQIVVGVSNFLTSYGLWLLLGLVLLVVGSVLALRRPPVRLSVHGALLRLPLVGKLVRAVNGARFARAFGTLVQGGSPVLEAMTAATQTVKNAQIRMRLDAAGTQVREGKGVAAALKAVDGLPPMLGYMAAAGERSGQLGLMLHKSADYLESEFDGFTKSALSLLEPMIVIFMGGIVGAIVLSIMLPILRLNSLVLM
ncbi:type II secretion system inner membrane protein GspF [Kordiimonas lipolytica]|uniref:General secretion pathway protein F n=1 Tax=Kordiimonas lipolytica TaxID=1662421 RepID=A0ABV8UBL1_9PROT|nr:type II secretion system inner membrane protein GspF [Kordiimonas lipolytica]